ncbi:hypothetical protein F5Y19DRAFT_447614 [Xylariaceae sp. FL1651]|nr:hypothetical protein F5Y19DRAFT_447614 [Xylariaceae sp. FL1651]
MTFLVTKGQDCALAMRVYVHEEVANEFIAKGKGFVKAHASALGENPLSETICSSPLNHHRQKKTVLSYIKPWRKDISRVLRLSLASQRRAAPR